MSRQLKKICELKDQTIKHAMAIGVPFSLKIKLLAEKGSENFLLMHLHDKNDYDMWRKTFHVFLTVAIWITLFCRDHT